MKGPQSIERMHNILPVMSKVSSHLEVGHELISVFKVNLYIRRKDNLQAHIRRVHPELSHVNVISATKSSGFEEEDEDLERTSETPVRELEEVESKFFFVNPEPSEDEDSNHQQTSNDFQAMLYFASSLCNQNYF